MNKQAAEIDQKVLNIKKYLSKDSVQKVVEENYIKQIIAQNPDLKLKYIIQHINMVQLSGANPFKNQVYLTSYFSKRIGEHLGTTVFSFRFFQDRANQTGQFKGCPCVVEKAKYFNPATGKDVDTLKATAIAYRKNGEPVEFVAWYPECNDDRSPIWRTKPHTMLRKCAIAGALRDAFPETLGSFYVPEEMNEASDLIEQEIKTVENEQSFEKSQLQKQKTKKLIEDAKSTRKKAPKIKIATDLIDKITSGFEISEKFEFLKNELHIDSIERMNNWSGKELDLQITRLETMLSSPIVMPEEKQG